ncbi:YlbD family protein [Rossellomorea aquimaris]|uniref:YlbD family protein n=1 Tax=Rossellomorea aquimaris TaxID=189382 RepID=UPI001CD3525F|nr:YlbD family protein [Rossellomorea aquimaris]MCA1053389.1 YlbD family protein [Rossellomorea aquimaris]
MGKSLHPKVKEFKEFVRKNPKIIKDVRNGNTNWQDLFEDWYILGEEDTRWDSYRDGEKSSEAKAVDSNKNGWFDSVGELVKNMDANQLQSHINNISEVLGTVQGVISQFSSNPKSPTVSSDTRSKPSHPFSFRKD